MTQPMSITCPHCGAANVGGAAFCESCGKALPSAMPAGPRVVDGSSFAVTSAGQRLQSDELQKQARKAAGALLAVAIIQTAVCGILLAVANSTGRIDVMFQNAAFLGLAGSAVIFWCLYIWSRRQPLPAAIVGLVFYATLIVINVIVSVSQLSAPVAQQSPRGFGGIGIGWLDIVILAVLARAISAGAKYRKMTQANV